MVKKSKLYFTMCVTLLMVAMFGCFTAMASNDLMVSADKTLTSKFNKYDNVTVKSGATLSLGARSGEPVGLEVVKSLVVAEGAKITGDGLLIFHRGATFSGITLYYKYQGEYLAIPKGMQLDGLGNEADDYKPEFYFDKARQIYVLNAEFNGGDPFQLNISERHISVMKKDKHKLTLSGITEGVKWSTSDKSIATVSAKGVVKAKKTGSVVITATYEGKEYICDVDVVDVGLNFKELFMNVGNEFFLQLNGATLKSVSSSNKKVAKISKKLLVSAVGVGECTLTVKCKDGTKYKCKVMVE